MPAHLERDKILEFPSADEQLLGRIKAEAERLANQTELERNFFVPQRAEALGVPIATLKAAVNSIVKERNQHATAERKPLKRRIDEERQRREQEEKRKQQAEKQAERAKLKAEMEVERKAKKRAQGFSTILKLPVAQHDGELAKLAKRLGEDAGALRQELQEFAGVVEGISRPTDWRSSHGRNRSAIWLNCSTLSKARSATTLS
jgi:hypothetical protein